MIIHKIFWAWDDDKEEAWLRQMAQSGWHLAQVKLFTYIFVTGAARDSVYRLDFMPDAGKKDEYFQLFQDSGWEHVDKFTGWEYWRKDAHAGEDPQIFTDPGSRSRKYRLLFRLEMVILLLVAADALYLVSLSTRYGDNAILVAALIALFFFPLLVLICLRLWHRIRQLRSL